MGLAGIYPGVRSEMYRHLSEIIRLILDGIFEDIKHVCHMGI